MHPKSPPKEEKGSNRDKIKELEDELKKTEYNKKTQYHIGKTKAKIAMLKEKEETRKRGKAASEGFTVKKSGDATAILLGYPSVGKSTLLNSLTNANSKVGAYDFTTLDVIPGLLEYNHAKIQILDVPGIVKGASKGTGRGKEVISVLQNADIVIMILDVTHPEFYTILLKEVYDSSLRLNKKKPDVKIKKMAKNGIRVGTTVKLTKIDVDMIKSIFMEFRINNAEVLIRQDISDDELIDCIEGNKKYVPAVVVLNKMDMVPREYLEEIMKTYPIDLMISAQQKTGMEQLKRLIYDRLEFMSLFLKQPGQEADMKEPMIIFKGSTVRDICRKLHKDFESKFKFARIWGRSVKFSGQKVLNLDHVLAPMDILELRMR